MKKMNKEVIKRKIQHELNTALNNCVNIMKIKLPAGLEDNLCVEHDYYNLLEKFEQHLELLKKISKRRNEL
jgi:hypothetical protein